MFTPPASPPKRSRSPRGRGTHSRAAGVGAPHVNGPQSVYDVDLGHGAHSPVAAVGSRASSSAQSTSSGNYPRAAHSPANSIPWDRFLTQALKLQRARMGMQLRPLELPSACSGLGTHAFAWRALNGTGMSDDVLDMAGAEPKCSANKFTMPRTSNPHLVI